MKALKIASIFLFVILTFIGCGSQEKNATHCNKTFGRQAMSIDFKELKSKDKSDSSSIHQLRFVCTRSARETGKIMFASFGDWNELVYDADKYWPNVLWESVDLLNDGKKYIVFTSGIESTKERTFSGVIVFDELGNDALAEDSNVKDELVAFFTERLDENSTDSSFSVKLNEQVYKEKNTLK